MNLMEWIKSIVVLEEVDEEPECVPETTEDEPEQNRIAVYDPRHYKDAMQIADVLLAGNDVVINLKHLDQQSRLRFTDFLSGVTYHRECKLSFTGSEVLVCYWENSKDE